MPSGKKRCRRVSFIADRGEKQRTNRGVMERWSVAAAHMFTRRRGTSPQTHRCSEKIWSLVCVCVCIKFQIPVAQIPVVCLRAGVKVASVIHLWILPCKCDSPSVCICVSVLAAVMCVCSHWPHCVSGLYMYVWSNTEETPHAKNNTDYCLISKFLFSHTTHTHAHTYVVWHGQISVVRRAARDLPLKSVHFSAHEHTQTHHRLWKQSFPPLLVTQILGCHGNGTL